jgi:hypothetical protein
MDVYYNTGDGAMNSNPTLIILPSGGNAQTGGDWSTGFATAQNSSVNPALWGLVDGTAFAGTPAAGTHWNVVAPQTQSVANLTVNTQANSGTSTISITNGGDNHFWPSGNYTICVGISDQDCFPVSSQTGSYSSVPITVNIGSYQWTANHLVGEQVWAEDTNGQGGPTYPNWAKWTVCDLARLAPYLHAVGFGNNQIAIWGVSGTTWAESDFVAYGKSVAGMSAPKGCGFSSPDTSYTNVAFQLVSPFIDMGFGIQIGNNGITANSPAQPSGCGNYTWAPSTAWQALMGAYASTNNGVGSATMSNPYTYSLGAVNWTSPTSLAQTGRNISLPGCIPGTANSCYYGSNSDGYIGQSQVEGGHDDNSNPCLIQQAWLQTGPGSQGGDIQASPVGHGAVYTYNAGATGASCGGTPSNCYCGTGAITASPAGMCPNSQVFVDLVKLLSNLHVYGNVNSGGIVAGGIH